MIQGLDQESNPLTQYIVALRTKTLTDRLPWAAE